MAKTNKKNKKKHKSFGKAEYFFNFFSLIILISIGVYFGYRSYHYYGVLNIKAKEDRSITNVILANQKLVKSGDGFHKADDGYYYKGNVTDNYIKYSNRIYRIIGIDADRNVKVVSDDIVGTVLYGENESYQSSNVRAFLNLDEDNTGTGVYYSTLPNPNRFLADTTYSEDKLLNNSVDYSDKFYHDKISTLTIDDYVRAGGKKSYLNIGKYFWLIGFDADKNNLFVTLDGGIESGYPTDSYGVRAVFSFKDSINIASGSGTKDDPYIIDQGDDKNYVGSYVKLGNDTYFVSQDHDGIVKLIMNGYLTVDGQEVLHRYSIYTSYYENVRKHLCTYLNDDYFGMLPYQNLLLDTNLLLGEISTDNGYSYLNLYQDIGVYKIGILNMFDYNPLALDDYYLLNTLSEVGSMVYVYHKDGYLEEERIEVEKHIVPVIQIDRNLLKVGTGTIDDPYRTE